MSRWAERFATVVSSRLPAIYLIVVLLTGGSFCLIKPAFFTADENNHVRRTFELAHGELVGRVIDHAAGSEVDSNLLLLGERLWMLEQESLARVPPGSDAPNGQVTGLQLEALRGTRLARRTEFAIFQNTAGYPPELYVPEILALRVGMWRDMTIMHMLLLARVLATLCAAGIGFVSMRLAGRERWLICVCLLLPTGLNLAASCSQDALILPMAALASVLVGRALAERRRMTGWEVAGAAALLAMVIDARPPYLPLALLLFLPALEEVQPEWRRLWGPVLGLVFVVLVIAHWQLMIRPLGRAMGPGANAAQQVHLLWARPWRGGGALVKATLFFAPRTVFQGPALFGMSNDGSAPQMLHGVMRLSIAVLILLSLGAGLTRWRARMVLLSIILGTTAAICTAEYLMWTPVGAGMVEGLQSRYFIVLCPVAALLVRRRLDEMDSNRRLGWLVAFTLIFFASVLAMPWVLAHRFYHEGLLTALSYGLM